MVSITLSVPEETRKLMKQFPEMNWSGFVRKSIEQKTKALAQRDKWLKLWREQDEKISEWALEIQKKGRKGRARELKEQGFL